ncbi:MAG TPA: phospholipase C, phosphocholine-specific [Chitinophagaceae bacterium]|nr:phospholipase C, phosphocholine-specific [Chitinophagaceae bacterium]
MDSRREFIKKATALAGGMGFTYAFPPSIQKAFAIDPVKGTTYLDAEHVVILMQENRSFDHCYGSLQGVRGFNDPRAINLPDGDLVWLQKNAAGEAYIPFRLDIKGTKSTWIGSLPHSWADQVDARNGGKYDKWLIAKPSGNKPYANAPLTMGYYNREDIPFYYALADAFTVCDQNFCSSLTGTTPNRLYLWTGTIREKSSGEVNANVRNENVDYEREVSWTSFPERLEDNGISWKIYQNEISLASGFEGEEDSWLANFTDNPIEWFSQYNVRFSKTHREYIQKMLRQLPAEINALEIRIKEGIADKAALEKATKDLNRKKEWLEKIGKEASIWTEENFAKLSRREKNLHTKAFTTNINDPFYRQLDTLEYEDDGVKRKVKLPKGDVLHQFRKDVQGGALPAVSWLVAPENFSDHPGAPWYGAWYVSEVMDILTQNPEVWKKTIFILCYDENDGYFDHVPPFVPHDPKKSDTGLTSAGIDTSVEHVTLEQDLKGRKPEYARGSAIGLGYRVPLVIASPWSRGGAVCSQVFDHTSILQLLENVFSRKAGKQIRETNISSWRRTVCGDLGSVFRPCNGEKTKLPAFLEQHGVIESIHKAQFRKDPFGYRPMSKDEIAQINKHTASSVMPRQEKGTRPACPLPYQLYAAGGLNKDKKTIELRFSASKDMFKEGAAGSPFTVYAAGKYGAAKESGRNWNYTVAAGDELKDSWPLDEFDEGCYHLKVHGPNGFFREFAGDKADPGVSVKIEYLPAGDISIHFMNNDADKMHEVMIKDNAYKNAARSVKLGSSKIQVKLNLAKSYGWYDFTVSIAGNDMFMQRCAGHVETGKMSRTDPAMGGEV